MTRNKIAYFQKSLPGRQFRIPCPSQWRFLSENRMSQPLPGTPRRVLPGRHSWSEGRISVWTHNFYEIGTYLATIKIVPYKFVQVFVTIVCFPFGRNYILKKGVPDPLSRINIQRTILKRKVNPALDRIIKIPDSVSSKKYNSLIIFQLI
jgi:hypothetical protein